MSLGLRAVIAVVLMVLFYALAFGAAIGSIVLAATVAPHLDQLRGTGLLWGALAVLGLLVLSFVIVWSAVPRLDRFEAPGPEITAEQHPALFEEIRRVADATNQRMPSHVYLMHDVNAFVAQRGGIMGIGSRRVMGIGIPLMRILNVDELRGVLAHEMGHFHGGDTKLGPWIYKTRGALARTVVNLERVSQADFAMWQVMTTIVKTPFRGFFSAFMRITQAISRAQELGADRIAVRVVGKAAVVAGLRKTCGVARAYGAYVREEIAPLVEAGALPPIGEGFTRFMSDERIAKLVDEVAARALAAPEDPYDSHPPTRDRIAAIEKLADSGHAPDTRPATDLLASADDTEAALIAEQIGKPLERISWDDVERIWIARWREQAREVQAVLKGLRPDNIPIGERLIYERAVTALGMAQADQLGELQLRMWWCLVLAPAIAVVIIDAGFDVSVKPGQPVIFMRGELRFETLLDLSQLISQEITKDEWLARWNALGIGNPPLVPS